MDKEEITVISQLLSGMKDAITELEKAQKKKDVEMMNSSKKEILNLKEQLDKRL